MDDLAFLESYGAVEAGAATLKVVLPDGQVHHISDQISPFQFLDRCPLLYHAFEYGFMARLQASIEASSLSAAIALVRYCYTGNYLPACTEDIPGLLLLHAQTYKLAEDFDVPELQLLAHGNFSCQIEMACCQPTPPCDLLDTIRFVYQYFANGQQRLQNGLISTLCNYCISIFIYHRLGADPSFMQLVSELPEFGQDLCRTNMERNFEDDCAFDIVRLSLTTTTRQPSHHPAMLETRDLMYEMMAGTPIQRSQQLPSDDLANAINAALDELTDTESHASNQATPQPRPQEEGLNVMTLVHRLRTVQDDADAGFETDSSSDEDGFSFVHLPRRPQAQPFTPDEAMSSPELVSSEPIDVLAATGSNYPSDDEWSLV